jgi:hypothetical protein
MNVPIAQEFKWYSVTSSEFPLQQGDFIDSFARGAGETDSFPSTRALLSQGLVM